MQYSAIIENDYLAFLKQMMIHPTPVVKDVGECSESSEHVRVYVDGEWCLKLWRIVDVFNPSIGGII